MGSGQRKWAELAGCEITEVGFNPEWRERR
jgi:hypothetical protein